MCLLSATVSNIDLIICSVNARRATYKWQQTIHKAEFGAL